MKAAGGASSLPPELPGGDAAGGAALQGPIAATWNALSGIYDPELYLDVVSLGLVYEVRWEGRAIVVEMTLTTPGCPVSESLPEMAKAAVAEAVGEGAAVEVRVVWDPPWDPSMMDAAAATALGFRTGS